MSLCCAADASDVSQRCFLKKIACAFLPSREKAVFCVFINDLIGCALIGCWRDDELRADWLVYRVAGRSYVSLLERIPGCMTDCMRALQLRAGE